jgi:hypothetical protein
MFTHLKTQRDSEYSFERYSQYAKGNTVKDMEDSNLDGILIAATCVSSLQHYKPMLPKVNVSPTFEYV